MSDRETKEVVPLTLPLTLPQKLGLLADWFEIHPSGLAPPPNLDPRALANEAVSYAELSSEGLDAMVAEVGAWADETFRSADRRQDRRRGDYRSSIVAHLCAELVELAADPSDMEEVADCMLLLMDLAHQNGGGLTGFNQKEVRDQ